MVNSELSVRFASAERFAVILFCYSIRMNFRELFIVEVDAFEGEAASISVTDADGAPLRAVYCVARRDEASGVLHFVDYGYTSIREAREAWPEAQ